jgi:hypothetical protein
MFSEGILTCLHDGTGGPVIKMVRGTLVPLKSGDLGILHELRFLLGLYLLLGEEANFRCNP